jgi:hypothetical protein
MVTSNRSDEDMVRRFYILEPGSQEKKYLEILFSSKEPKKPGREAPGDPFFL